MELPLFEQIEKIEEERNTGCLRLWHKDQVVGIYFRDGLIEAVSSNRSQHRLGQYLLREGLLDLSKLNKLLSKSHRRENTLGETALRAGILDVSHLTRLIHLQASTLLRLCLENGFEVHSFEAVSPSFNCSAPMNLHALLLGLARKDSKTLTLDFDQVLHLRKREKISLLPWSPEELSVLSHLNTPRTLPGLVSVTGIQQSEVRSVLKVLFDLGFIELSKKKIPSNETSQVKKEPLSLENLIPKLRYPALNGKLKVMNDEFSFVSEQFAALKVQIEVMGKGRPARIIGICSSCSQDGKSLIASNLALSYAKESGRRVILLDFDLRNPNVQGYFGIPLEPGIIGYLKDERLEPYCYLRRVGSLYLMTAGGVADNPIELLSHRKIGKLINYLRKEFDTVVLDSPPLDLVSDTRILFKLVDGIALVIRKAKTPYGAVKRTLRILDHDKFLGVVFNDVTPQLLHTYYNHSHYYHGNAAYPYYSRGRGKD
jgi:capsular exopolysaccharide synthesis family protein